jgi:hypothetical protein
MPVVWEFLMNFSNKLTASVLVISLLFMVACSSDEEQGSVVAHLQAHQLKIVNIELSSEQTLVIRSGSDRAIQFNAYGLLADGSRLQTEADDQGNTSDQTINHLVEWSIDEFDFALAQISDNGLVSNVEGNGIFTVTAEISGLSAAASVVVSDAELVEVVIDNSTTSVDVCLNLELLARGILADGNVISFEDGEVLWTVDDNDTEIANFRDDSFGVLATYLTGNVSVYAEDIASQMLSSQVVIAVTGGLESIMLSNTNENSVNVGESIEINATATYPNGEFDITDNTTFISRNNDLASFEGNILTAADGTEENSVEIIAACGDLTEEISIDILVPTK